MRTVIVHGVFSFFSIKEKLLYRKANKEEHSSIVVRLTIPKWWWFYLQKNHQRLKCSTVYVYNRTMDLKRNIVFSKTLPKKKLLKQTSFCIKRNCKSAGKQNSCSLLPFTDNTNIFKTCLKVQLNEKKSYDTVPSTKLKKNNLFSPTAETGWVASKNETARQRKRS